jgi:hypothetical protein
MTEYSKPVHNEPGRQLTFGDLFRRSVFASIEMPKLPQSPALERYVLARAEIAGDIKRIIEMGSEKEQLSAWADVLANRGSNPAAFMAGFGDALASVALGHIKPTRVWQEAGKFLSDEIFNAWIHCNRRGVKEPSHLTLRRLGAEHCPQPAQVAAKYREFWEKLARAVQGVAGSERQIRVGQYYEVPDLETLSPGSHPAMRALEGLRTAVVFLEHFPELDKELFKAGKPLGSQTVHGWEKLLLASYWLDKHLAEDKMR